MSKHCLHALRSTHYDDLACEPPLVRVTSQCFRCGIWLPLGLSDETPVAAEVRAAEIADGWPDGEQSDDEDAGWRAHMTGGDLDASPSILAGWLAREIWLEAASKEPAP